MARRQRVPCPTPDKATYRNPVMVYNAASGLVRFDNRQGLICPALYSYRCACGHLHLTKRAEWNGRANTLVLDVPEELQRWAFPA